MLKTILASLVAVVITMAVASPAKSQAVTTGQICVALGYDYTDFECNACVFRNFPATGDCINNCGNNNTNCTSACTREFRQSTLSCIERSKHNP